MNRAALGRQRHVLIHRKILRAGWRPRATFLYYCPRAADAVRSVRRSTGVERPTSRAEIQLYLCRKKRIASISRV